MYYSPFYNFEVILYDLRIYRFVVSTYDCIVVYYLYYVYSYLAIVYKGLLQSIVLKSYLSVRNSGILLFLRILVFTPLTYITLILTYCLFI